MTHYTPRNKNYRQAVQTLFDSIPYHQANGIGLDEIQPGYARGHMDRIETLTQQNGYFQAGALVGLADMVGGAAAYSLMGEGENVLSVNFAVSLMRPADYDRIWAEGRVIKAGKRLYVAEAKLYGDETLDRLLVSATITLMAV